MTNRKRALAKFRAMTKNVRTTTTVGLWACTGGAIALAIASFFWPPAGVIDGSVIKMAAEMFGFAALWELREAVLEGIGVKLTHGATTIEVKDQDGTDEETQNPEENGVQVEA